MVASVRVGQYYLSALQLSAVLNAVIGGDLFPFLVTGPKINHFLYHATNVFCCVSMPVGFTLHALLLPYY